MTHRHITPQMTRRAAGFTLTEILMALGIFMIGMIAVVSLFPVAALLQRETASDIISLEVAASAEAIVQTKALSVSTDLNTYHASAGPNQTDIVPLAGLASPFPHTDRSYPSAQIAGTNTSNCDLFWVPFIQDLNGDPANPNWVMHLVVLEPDANRNFTNLPSGISDIANTTDPVHVPRVVRAGCTYNTATPDVLTLAAGLDKDEIALTGGDLIIDSNGVSYIVAGVDGLGITLTTPVVITPAAPGSIWFAPPPLSASDRPLGTRSLIRRILLTVPTVTTP